MNLAADRWYYCYVVASRSRVLYIGITSDLMQRVYRHRSGSFHGFSSDYKCYRLVWFEQYSLVGAAISREKQLKGWRREKKVRLIVSGNPGWEDLSCTWSGAVERS